MTHFAYFLTTGYPLMADPDLPPLGIQARMAVDRGVWVNPLTLETGTEWSAA